MKKRKSPIHASLIGCAGQISAKLAKISGLFFTCPVGAQFITPSGLAPSTRCRAPSGSAGLKAMKKVILNSRDRIAAYRKK